MTVAIGLGVVAVLFTILNTLLFRVDQVPDISRDVRGRAAAAGQRRSLAVDASAFRSDASGNAASSRTPTRRVTEIDLRVDGRMMAVTLVTGQFLPGRSASIRSWDARSGRPMTIASGGNPVIVLSDKGWDRHFNRDPNVLGRTVLVNGAPFEIIGVMPAGFRGLEVGGARLLGAAVAAGATSVPADRGREDSRRRGDRRPAETGRVDGERSRAAGGLGFEPIGGRRRPPRR